MKKINNKLIPKKEYRNIIEKMPFCCVDLLIHSGRKILLVKRENEPAKGEWWPPGGRIYKNEPLLEAAIRKGQEEVGLNLKNLKITGVYETFFDKGIFPDLKTGTHTINVVFSATPENNNQIQVDKTSSEFIWINKLGDKYHDYVRKIVKDSKIFE